MDLSRSDNSVAEQIRTVGADLAQTLRVMIRQTDADLSVPQHVARTFGINAASSHRLATALRKDDPIAMMLQIPGPAPLRKILETAKKRGVNSDDIKRANQAVDQFERLIRNVAGDRSGLDLIIGAMLPDESSRYEPAAKQLVYRGMRQLKGIAADVQFETIFLFPGDHPKLLSNVLLHGYIGYRRLRPGTNQGLGMYSIMTNPQRSVVVRALDNTPLAEDPHAVVLDEFSTQPEQIEYTEVGERMLITCNWGGLLGNPSACNLVFAERRNTLMRGYYEDSDERSHTALAHEILIPTKVLVADFMLPPGVYPDWEPNVHVMELGQRGTNLPDNPNPTQYRFDTAERVLPLGTGVDAFASRDIPRYLEMLRYTCDKIGVDPNRLRGYRARIEYPMYGTEILFRFKLPPAPE